LRKDAYVILCALQFVKMDKIGGCGCGCRFFFMVVVVVLVLLLLPPAAAPLLPLCCGVLEVSIEVKQTP